MCNCVECQIESLGLDPGDDRAVGRGGDMISCYMRDHNVSFPEAVEALAAQRRKEWAELAAIYGERHGLDPDAVNMAFWRHGVNGPAVLQ